MPIMRELEKIPNRDLHIFYVLDTSESMIGTPIAMLNRAMKEMIDILKYEAKKNADANLKIAVLEFNSNSRWVSSRPEEVSNFIWRDLQAGGLTQVGDALAELNSKLSRNAFLNSMTGAYVPIIIFMSAGHSTDDYKRELDKIRQNNKWFRRATKIGFALGENADLKMIAEVVGNSEAVIRTNELYIFSKLIRFVSVTASMLASQSQTSTTAVDGASIVKEVVGRNRIPDEIIVGEDGGNYESEPEWMYKDNFSVEDSYFDNSWCDNKFDWDDEWDTEIPLPQCRVCGENLSLNANYCSFCGSKVEIEKPKMDLKKVQFSAIAPKNIIKGEYSIINIIMYEQAFRKAVDEIIAEAENAVKETKSGFHEVDNNAVIKVVLFSPDLSIEDNEETQIWNGGYINFSFAVMLPEDYKKHQILFSAIVYINDIIATKLKFIVKCSSLKEQEIEIVRNDIFSAFVSYASEDRRRVAIIIQGMKKARPDMDIFFDVDSLRSGDDWERAIHQEIEKRDILFLCWSHFARESKWVNAEWRYVFENKGADYIEPIPIELPDICPPPKELKHKHFNDKFLYIISATSKKKSTQNEFIQDTEEDIWEDW
ncbi:MAG: TIR domain-containing protein [Lachnospiraceae bacterium]